MSTFIAAQLFVLAFEFEGSLMKSKKTKIKVV